MELQRTSVHSQHHDDIEETMMKQEAGFTIVELLLVMIIFVFVLAGTSELFVAMVRGYKQQSKIAQTNIEGIIGLEMLRRDIEGAGYGLPWQMSGISYDEATSADATLNDSTSNPPRAIVNGDGLGPDIADADYLVIKAVNVAGNSTCTKWTDLKSSPPPTTSWIPSTENLTPAERVVVISPGTPTAFNSRTLVASTTFGGVLAFASPNETRIVYGVDPANLRMPFNRADYSISTSVPRPGRCAQGTGVLVKRVVKQSDGGFDSENTFPLLDCVADMQVSFKLDRNGNGTLDNTTVLRDGAGAELTAQQIRSQLKEVRVDILAHEGQMDTSYTYFSSTVLVGQSASLGRNFDFVAQGIPNWQNYRWKVYTLILSPSNLM